MASTITSQPDDTRSSKDSAAVRMFGGDVSDERPAGKATSKLEKSERRRGLFFVSPWVLGVLLFYLLPIVASLVFSFTDYQLVDENQDGTKWVGLENWRRVFSDPVVWTSTKVTLRFAFFAMPLSIFAPLGLAYILTAKQLWGRTFFRTMFFMPTMVPFVSSVFIWRGYLNDSDGWANRILGTAGIDGPNWLQDGNWVLPTFALMGLWGIGNAFVIFTAALNGVPTDLYEAATLDGAGKWHLFRHVTWPMISPVTFYNVVISLVGLGQYFLVPFVLTNGTGDPDNQTLFYTMYFYRQTFKFFEAGYGATLAWAMFLVIISFTAVLFWSAKYWVHYQFEERS